jgi:mRNA interferase MazF
MTNGAHVPAISRFSVYWFDPDPVRGSELSKTRPGVVVTPDEMNSLLRTVLIVPLTSTVVAWPFRFNLTIMGQTTSAACDQLRAVDKSRIRGHIQDLSSKERERLLGVLRTMLAE